MISCVLDMIPIIFRHSPIVWTWYPRQNNVLLDEGEEGSISMIVGEPVDQDKRLKTARTEIGFGWMWKLLIVYFQG
jgi:hypothetical protein